MIMIELEPEHCEFKENVKKVKTIFIENYTDEYKEGDADEKISEELKKTDWLSCMTNIRITTV